MKDSTIATLGGLITTLGVAWALFLGSDYELPIGIKMIIAAMPVLGGLITKNFHRK